MPGERESLRANDIPPYDARQHLHGQAPKESDEAFWLRTARRFPENISPLPLVADEADVISCNVVSPQPHIGHGDNGTP
jgi:hypothetical protein